MCDHEIHPAVWTKQGEKRPEQIRTPAMLQKSAGFLKSSVESTQDAVAAALGRVRRVPQVRSPIKMYISAICRVLVEFRKQGNAVSHMTCVRSEERLIFLEMAMNRME